MRNFRLTTDMMGMGTPKMDGSVEPNSWLEDRAETQSEFTFDWQPHGERRDENNVYKWWLRHKGRHESNGTTFLHLF